MLQLENTEVKASAGLILLAGISTIGLFITRDQTQILSLAYFSSFFAYFWLAASNLSFVAALSIGTLTRLVLFFSLPTLSDDIYRFIWDGQLLVNGISPYSELPIYFMDPKNRINGLSEQLFNLLNSPEYYSVYPPLNQLLFWCSSLIGVNNWLMQANVFRVVLLGADIGCLLLLRNLLNSKGRSTSLANWYWLNPLVILEFTGNLHFEGLVVFFVLLGLYFIHKNDLTKSAIAFGLAIATKLLPLIYIPALAAKLVREKNALMFFAALLMVLSITLFPVFLNKNPDGMAKSLELYFNKFEFNASIYFVLRTVGFWLVGYNTISSLGPALSITTLLSILFLTYGSIKNNWPFEKTFLFSLSIYLLLSTTVHPWYILPLIALGVYAGYYYPVWWSLFIFSTYFGYDQLGYKLSPGWIFVEYTAVLLYLAFELSNGSTYRKLKSNLYHKQ